MALHYSLGLQNSGAVKLLHLLLCCATRCVERVLFQVELRPRKIMEPPGFEPGTCTSNCIRAQVAPAKAPDAATSIGETISRCSAAELPRKRGPGVAPGDRRVSHVVPPAFAALDLPLHSTTEQRTNGDKI